MQWDAKETGEECPRHTATLHQCKFTANFSLLEREPFYRDRKYLLYSPSSQPLNVPWSLLQVNPICRKEDSLVKPAFLAIVSI